MGITQMKIKPYDLDDGYLNLLDQQKVKTNDSFSSVHTREDYVSDSGLDVVLEPIQSDSYDLSYTCLLIPRFPSHQIKGDLADFLTVWLQQICISYGWRLEFSTAHLNYFQWGLRVNASVTPATFMHLIRTETSNFILSNFGRIAKENLSDDFWAPGFLVVLGIRPHSDEMIENYIQMTRRRQGLHTL